MGKRGKGGNTFAPFSWYDPVWEVQSLTPRYHLTP